MNLTVNGYELYYTDVGSGAPILLLHGWGSSTEVWRLITEHLKNRYRVIALDFPGCGKSALPGQPMTLTDYTELVAEFIGQLGLENPIIMGHSNGGRVTINLLGTQRASAQKAVLFDSAGLRPKKSAAKTLKIAAFKTVKFLLTLPGLKPHTAQALDRARKHFGSADYNSAPPVMRQTLVNLVNVDLSDRLPHISCPTLLIWGEDDTATPLSNAKKMEKLIPDAGLCSFKGCGHFSFLERPGDTAAILDSFLSAK